MKKGLEISLKTKAQRIVVLYGAPGDGILWALFLAVLPNFEKKK